MGGQQSQPLNPAVQANATVSVYLIFCDLNKFDSTTYLLATGNKKHVICPFLTFTGMYNLYCVLAKKLQMNLNNVTVSIDTLATGRIATDTNKKNTGVALPWSSDDESTILGIEMEKQNIFLLVNASAVCAGRITTMLSFDSASPCVNTDGKQVDIKVGGANSVPLAISAANGVSVAYVKSTDLYDTYSTGNRSEVITVLDYYSRLMQKRHYERKLRDMNSKQMNVPKNAGSEGSELIRSISQDTQNVLNEMVESDKRATQIETGKEHEKQEKQRKEELERIRLAGEVAALKAAQTTPITSTTPVTQVTSTTPTAEHVLEKSTTVKSMLEANKKQIASATAVGVAALGALYAAGKTSKGKQAIGMAQKKLEDAVSTRYKLLTKSVQKVVFNMSQALATANKTKDPVMRASTLMFMGTRAVKDLQTALVKTDDPGKYERSMYDQDVLLEE
jgi:hypothetical protein